MKLLDDAAVEARYGIKRGTLRTWRTRNQGPPYIRISDRMARYPEDQLEAWLASRTVRP